MKLLSKKFIAKILLVATFCLHVIGCTSVQEQFDSASRIGSTDALKLFLKENPNSTYSEQTKSMITNTALKNARVINTEAAYQKIINENPGNSKLYRLANSKIEHINYTDAQDQDTIESYKSFILRFPFGKSRIAALSRIEAITFKNMKKKTNLSSLTHYLQMAKYNKEDIKQAQKLLVKTEFESARKSNTIQAYQSFLTRYEDSVYAIKATERLINLRLPSTLYLSEKGHVAVQLGKITSISKNTLVASYGKTASQEFSLSKKTRICSKSNKKMNPAKLESNQQVSIATIPSTNLNKVVAIYIGKTTVAINRNEAQDNQPSFVNFPNCFPPISKR